MGDVGPHSGQLSFGDRSGSRGQALGVIVNRALSISIGALPIGFTDITHEREESKEKPLSA
jgi:hypothetical protein